MTKTPPPPRKINLFGLEALYVAAALLLSGNSLQTILILGRARAEGFELINIGLLTTFYYIGFLIGCILVPRIITRVGHIRTFAVLAAVASSVAVTFLLWINPWFWCPMRFLTGFSLAGLFVVLESWINEMIPSTERGRALALFRVVDISATVAGQFLILSFDITSFKLFLIVTILLSLALIPIALTVKASPSIPETFQVNLRRVYRISPQSMIGCMSAGAACGSFWGMGPLYAIELGMKHHQIPLYMSSFLVGGFIAQWPIGLASDRYDRRRILNIHTVLAFLVCISCFLLASSWSRQYAYLFAFFYGVATLTLYPLCVAHAHDRKLASTDRISFVQISSSLLIAFSIGAASGPLLSSLLKTYVQPLNKTWTNLDLPEIL